VAGLIHDVPTCKELIDRIMREAETIITRRLAGMQTGLVPVAERHPMAAETA
jgi:nitronate monooxygenase